MAKADDTTTAAVETKKPAAKKTKPKSKSKKLHVEIVPANWKKLEKYIARYNKNPNRVTPVLKYADVINAALDEYFRAAEAKG